jgi:purine-nucleoside phosphorylase
MKHPDIEKIAAKVKPLFPQAPDIALVLGSGLGDLAEELEETRRIATATLPGYPHSTVPGHKGFIISGKLHDKKLICFQGRIHLYEGYPVEKVVLPIQLASALGATRLIITNAAGGISDHLVPGSLMLITDQIDLQLRLRRRPDSDKSLSLERARWFQQKSPYSERLQEFAKDAALKCQVRLHPGTLSALLGPSYETPAEARMERILGADAASMSTVAEAAEAARLGMDVVGISCITNKVAGLPGSSLDHDEVIEVAARVKGQFIKLIKEIIRRI